MALFSPTCCLLNPNGLIILVFSPREIFYYIHHNLPLRVTNEEVLSTPITTSLISSSEMVRIRTEFSMGVICLSRDQKDGETEREEGAFTARKRHICDITAR